MKIQRTLLLRGFLLLGICGLLVMRAASVRAAEHRIQLVRILGNMRLSEGRFTGGFGYSRYKNYFTPVDLEREQKIKLRKIRKDLVQTQSPEALGDMAVLYALYLRAEDAVSSLERATHEKPGDALLLSDLSAALILRSEVNRRPFDLILALAAAERSLAISPRLPEAGFNKAIVLERLFLKEAAVSAWEMYISLDTDSEWAEEAAARLSALRMPDRSEVWSVQLQRLEDPNNWPVHKLSIIQAVVERFPQQVYEHVEKKLADWAAAVLTNKEDEARRSLQMARLLASSLEETNKDRSAAALVSDIDAATDDPSRLLAIAEDYSRLGDGRALYLEDRVGEAYKIFEGLWSRVEHEDGSFRVTVLIYIALCHYENSHYQKALLLLREAEVAADKGRYLSLSGRSRWIAGLSHLSLGDPVAALNEYYSAVKTFKNIRYDEDSGALNYLIAESLMYVGLKREATRHLYDALSAVPLTVNQRRVYTAFDQFANAVQDFGYPREALYFRNEVVRVARAHPDPVNLSHAYVRRAETEAKLGNFDRSYSDLELASRYSQMIDDEAVRRREKARLLATQGEIRSFHDPQQAVDLLTRSLIFYSENKNHFMEATLRLTRARSYNLLGNKKMARGDLSRGVQECGARQAEMPNGELRWAYRSKCSLLIHELLLLEVEAGAGETKLALAEQDHVSDLVDRNTLDHITNIKYDALVSLAKDRLPRGTAVVEFMVLRDRIIVWVIRQVGINFLEIKIEEEALGSLVLDLRSEILDEKRTSNFSSALYELLIRPMAPFIKGCDHLVFIPDKSLFGIAFSALYNERSGRYLLEDRRITLAPSMLYYVGVVERTNKRSVSKRIDSDRETVLITGNALAERKLFSSIVNLPEAGREIAVLNSLYPNAIRLDGLKATKSQFLLWAKNSSIIHFVGHAIPNVERPDLSALLFSPEPGNSGTLYARDLEEGSLPNTKLTFLASCATSSDGKEVVEGGVGLARAFLRAGSESVIFNSWDVVDRRMAILSIEFHENLINGISMSESLRQAQLKLFNSNDPYLSSPSSWAGLQIWGTLEDGAH